MESENASRVIQDYQKGYFCRYRIKTIISCLTPNVQGECQQALSKPCLVNFCYQKTLT